MSRKFEYRNPRRRPPHSRLLLIPCLCILGCLVVVLIAFAMPQASAYFVESWEPDIRDSSQSGDFPQEEEWNLTLVNSRHPLPENYSPELSPIDGNGEQFDSRASGSLQAMLDKMREEGLSPVVCSGYRSRDLQQTLFDNRVERCLDEGIAQEDAVEEASRYVAQPGTSEHELGLAADIVSENYQLLVEEQENTAEQQWLMEHCTEYGFILRYPKDKTDLTGVSYEPWHYRYVGKETAQEIMTQGLCLEEYLKA